MSEDEILRLPDGEFERHMTTEHRMILDSARIRYAHRPSLQRRAEYAA